jgi:hypothetical protein
MTELRFAPGLRLVLFRDVISWIAFLGSVTGDPRNHTNQKVYGSKLILQELLDCHSCVVMAETCNTSHQLRVEVETKTLLFWGVVLQEK